MQNKNFVRNNRLLWAVKLIAAAFQVPATYHVFYKLFLDAGRIQIEAIFTSICAILLIDAFFLLVLYFLESDELSVTKKIPWAVAGIFLVVAVLIIGFIDEGMLAFAPRIVFILLIVTDLISLVTDYITIYNSREAQEQRLRNKQVICRKKEMNRAWKKAILALQPELEELQKQREITSLGINQTTKNLEPVKTIVEADDLPDGIIEVNNKEYAWTDRYGEIHVTAASGKPYSLRGAMIASARQNNNGVN